MPHVFEGELYAESLKFAVIASRFHQAIVDRLLDGAIECLERHGARPDDIEIYRVPGAFEIPAIAGELARTGKYAALVTIGVLIRGDTPHFDFICAQVTDGVSRATVDSRIPISFGVITCNTIEQARERTERGNNKGWEAALAAIEMANLYASGRLGERARGRPSPRRPLAPSPRRKGGG